MIGNYIQHPSEGELSGCLWMTRMFSSWIRSICNRKIGDYILGRCCMYIYICVYIYIFVCIYIYLYDIYIYNIHRDIAL